MSWVPETPIQLLLRASVVRDSDHSRLAMILAHRRRSDGEQYLQLVSARRLTTSCSTFLV
jgi:hypothetical protein